MAVPEEVKKAVLKELRRRQPLMDTALVKKDFLAWLDNFRFPGFKDKLSWNDCIVEYPPKPEESELSSGRRLRLAVRLFTSSNQYLFSVIECLAPDVRGIYIITVHANWEKVDRKMQKVIDEGYKGEFDNGLRARHVIWIQSFELKDLHSALDCCAVAVFGNELVCSEHEEISKIPIKKPATTALSLPDSIDS